MRLKEFFQKAKNRQKSRSEKFTQPLSPDEQEFARSMYQQCLQRVQVDPRSAKDMALVLLQMDLGLLAYKLIEPFHEQTDLLWLFFESLISAKQFVSLLDYCQQKKTQWAHDPNTLFSISYMEAIAYWELGERQSAFEIMENIASMRPDYRSASELIFTWREEIG